VEQSVRYVKWMQILLLTSGEVGISQQVLEQFIREWDEREVMQDEREFLDARHAG
jgi:hypothetical protein